jgi:probable rRNA maturation factor
MEQHMERDTHISDTEGASISPDRGPYLITVQVDEQYEDRVDADALHRLAMLVLEAEGKGGPLELGIVVTNDDEVHALNRQYLGHDYKTDVISFGMEDEMGDEVEFLTPEERPEYLGDVVISYDRAAEQAPEYGHDTEREVSLLMVHGLLHLLGYDDTDEESRDRMHARQEALVKLADPGLGPRDAL